MEEIKTGIDTIDNCKCRVINKHRETLGKDFDDEFWICEWCQETYRGKVWKTNEEVLSIKIGDKNERKLH